MHTWSWLLLVPTPAAALALAWWIEMRRTEQAVISAGAGETGGAA